MTTTTKDSTKSTPLTIPDKSSALTKTKSSSISLYEGMKNGIGFSAPIINDSGVWYEWLD